MSSSPSSGSERATLSDLRIDLDRLSHESTRGHAIDVKLDALYLEAVLEGTDARVDQAGQLDAHALLQVDETLLVRGRLQVQYSVPCARCLDDAVVDAGGEICVTYVPRARQEARVARLTEDPEGLELESNELDELVYDGRTADLNPMVREQIQLAYPMRALCERGERCRGLCSSCGGELNDTTDTQRCVHCGASLDDAPLEADEIPPWKAALQKIRDE